MVGRRFVIVSHWGEKEERSDMSVKEERGVCGTQQIDPKLTESSLDIDSRLSLSDGLLLKKRLNMMESCI